MGALKAVTIITGNALSGGAQKLMGLATQTLHLDPDYFAVFEDTSVIPSRVKATLKTTVASAINSISTITTNLAAVTSDLAALTFIVNSQEPYAVAGGAWDMPAVFVATAPPENVSAAIGQFVRVDVTAYTPGDILTVTLPATVAGDEGRRILIADISGQAIGNPNIEIQIQTTGGQTIDGGNIAVPYDVSGTSPRVSFVSTGSGWNLEFAT